MQGGLVQWQTLHRRPQVQDVSLGSAVGMEALKDILAQMRREGPLAILGLAVDRAGTAALLTATTEPAEHAQVLEYLLHGDLLT